MSSLADLPELIGFFSYSREDDEDSHGGLSALRDRIQRELRGQLGRTMRSFRLWQDKEAIAPGTLWESEIKTAVSQAVFFIPIITPTVVRSPYCKLELQSFLTRESDLGRTDLVFPILYIRVPELEDRTLQRNDPVLSIIAKRQYLDWREYRHRDVNSADIKTEVERFCANICDALRRTWLSPQEQERQEAAAAQRHRAETRQVALAGPAQTPSAMEAGRAASASQQDGVAGPIPPSNRLPIGAPRVRPAANWLPSKRAVVIGALLVIAGALAGAAVITRMMAVEITPTPVMVAPTPDTGGPAAPTSASAPSASTPGSAASPALPAANMPTTASPAPPQNPEALPPPTVSAPPPPTAAAPPPRRSPSAHSHRPYRY